MAGGRSVALVAVGVDRNGVQEELTGAASGAEAAAAWLKEQRRLGVSVRCTVITDAKGKPVTSRKVQLAAQKYVDRRACDLLILYFAGHGIVKGGGDEQVLLSKVGQFNDEAIDIAATAGNARYSGISHVVIISDACRSPVTYGGELDQVSGKPAIKRGNLEGAKSQVDTFYATEPSKTAKEYKGVGFFTEMLLTALRTCPPGIRSEDKKYAGGRSVVPAHLLAAYLEDIVPIEASQRVPSFEQTPDIIVSSHEPRFIAYAPKVGARGTPTLVAPMTERAVTVRDLPALIRTDALRDLREKPLREPLRHTAKGRVVPHDLNPLEKSVERAGITNDYLELDIDPQRRASFETRTGYIVVGAKATEVLVRGPTPDCLDTAEGMDIRLFPGNTSMPSRNLGSMIVILDDRTVCVVPVMPGYVGTIGVEEGRVRSLSFQFSSNEREYQRISPEVAEEFQRRRAMAASLAASGQLWRLARKDANELADFMRQGKRMDPSLGIYSSYAYSTAGNDEGAASVFQWVSDNYHDRPFGIPAAPVPFDVALLAGQITPERAARPPGFAPFCPLMTLGWSLLEANTFEHPLHDAIRAVGRHRLNAEWTTFRRRDVGKLLKAFERGDIQ